MSILKSGKKSKKKQKLEQAKDLCEIRCRRRNFTKLNGKQFGSGNASRSKAISANAQTLDQIKQKGKNKE